MALTTSPEVSWTCSQGSLGITSQGTEMLLLLIPSFHLISSWKPIDSIWIFNTYVSFFNGRVLVCLLQTKIIICRLWFQKDARPFPSIWNLRVLLWLRKEKSVCIHGGNLLTFPFSLLPPGLSLALSSPLRVGTQKGTPLQPLYWASFSRRPGPVFYLRNIFLFLNLSSSAAPDINALKPSEDHWLAEWLCSDYSWVMTHTLVVSLCLPLI